jgi:hypothetical protein
MPLLRTIREEELVERRIDEAINESLQLEEVYEGIKWKLAHSATTADNVVVQDDGFYSVTTQLGRSLEYPT